MFEWKITGVEKGIKEIEKELDFYSKEIEKEIKNLAIEARDVMRAKINGGRKRYKTPTEKPHLDTLIRVEKVLGEYGIGYGVGNIGDIEKLHGKGWKLLNFGGLPGKGKYIPGVFTDGAANGKFAGGIGKHRFMYNPGGNNYMKPKSLVKALNFIGEAINHSSIRWEELLGNK